MNKSKNDLKEPLFDYVKAHYWQSFRRNTTILSSTCRQLSLGIGSITGYIKLNNHPSASLCLTNIILILLVLFFLSDGAQYLHKSKKYEKLADDFDIKIERGEITEKSELRESPGMHTLTDFFFYIKLALLFGASILFIILLLKL